MTENVISQEDIRKVTKYYQNLIDDEICVFEPIPGTNRKQLVMMKPIRGVGSDHIITKKDE